MRLLPLLLAMLIVLTSCTTTSSDLITEPQIEVTTPLQIDLPMPPAPAYPQALDWQVRETVFTLPVSDMDRLIAWLAALKKWHTESLPTWLQFYGLTEKGKGSSLD